MHPIRDLTWTTAFKVSYLSELLCKTAWGQEVLLFLRLVVLLAFEFGKIIMSLSLSFSPVCAAPSTQQVMQFGSHVVSTGRSYWKHSNLKY